MDRHQIERDMDQYMEDEDLPPINVDEDPPPVGDLVAVDSVLRRIKRHTRDIAQIQDAHDIEVRRLERFRDDRVAGLAKAIAWDQRSVETFMREQAKAAGGKRTIKRVDGEIKLRPRRAAVEITDKAAFLAWVFGIDNGDREPGDPEYLKLTVEGETDGGALVVEQLSDFLVDTLAAVAAHPGAVRIKIEPAVSELAKLAPKDEKGNPVFADGVAPLLYGDADAGTAEVIPGVELHKDPTDIFTLTPSKED